MEAGSISFKGLSPITILKRFLHFVKEVRNMSSENEDSMIKLLFPKFTSLRDPKSPSALGIGPLKSLFERSKMVSFEAFEIETGIFPLRLFSPK